MSLEPKIGSTCIPVDKNVLEGPLYQNKLIHLCILQTEYGYLYKGQMSIQKCQETTDSLSRMICMGHPL